MELLNVADYWYKGFCPRTQQQLRLPRTDFAKAIATELMHQLAQDACYSREGKMYGILVVEDLSGEQKVLKAFSGLLNGQRFVEGWVPPISGKDELILQETETLVKLEAIKQAIIQLDVTQEKHLYETLFQRWQTRLQRLATIHRKRQEERQKQRQFYRETLDNEALSVALEKLNQASRRDKREKKQLKQKRDANLQPLQDKIATAEKQINQLKQQRKHLSRQLQTQLNAVYRITNFAGQTQSLQGLMPNGLPTGTGDCCAPKLLHYAAKHQLKPLAMAEFWWGPSLGDKKAGEFYEACQERCQPLLGFLLSGLASFNHQLYHSKLENNLEIFYEDDGLIAINKPGGLLAVPGRYHDNQDSVISRLRHLLPEGDELMTVHRLDQDTSGILLVAKNKRIGRQLSQQFQQRKVHKVYEAILSGVLLINQGIIELPLWGNPENRPYQSVDFDKGKASITQFRVMSREVNQTRVELIPITGRTHQLRVHCASFEGLGMPILGDRLYGNYNQNSFLCLHARDLIFFHPQLSKKIALKVPTPF